MLFLDGNAAFNTAVGWRVAWPTIFHNEDTELIYG